MAERENEDGRKMVWQEWDIGQRECRESSRTGVRDKGGGVESAGGGGEREGGRE